MINFTDLQSFNNKNKPTFDLSFLFQPIVKNHFIFALFLFFSISCKEKSEIKLPPILNDETELKEITHISAQAVSIISEEIQEPVVAYGHAWAVQPSIPDINGPHSIQHDTPLSSPISISSDLIKLTKNTAYNVRPYLKTAGGKVIYGQTTAFTTLTDFIKKLTQLLNDSLGGKDFGYSFILTKKGDILGEGYGGYQSRMSDPPGEIPLSLDSRMQIASMTKTLTAVAFLQVAAKHGIQPTDKIINYLPPYWVKGPNLEMVTFDDLLKHRSGIVGAGENCVNGAYF